MAAEKGCHFFAPVSPQRAPKARQPRWQIAPCAQHAVAVAVVFLVVIPEGDLRLLFSPQPNWLFQAILYKSFMLLKPSLLLRIEEAVLLLLTLFLYHHLHYSWLLFAALFLVPDLFMFGYLINPRLGAATYNLVHTLWFPVAFFFAGYILHWQAAPAIALIWIAHIATDRLLGFGLKYPTFFKDTHLQHIP
jgi:hypothetical protein